eukprot:5120008-Alexandrium_andersonii.AAC.1
MYVELGKGVKDPSFSLVHNVDNTRACSVTWRSWCWQYRRFQKPAAREALGQPMPRLFVDFGPDSLIKIGARKAFWQLPVSSLQLLGQVKNIDLGPATGLCEVLYKLVQGVLACSDDET